MHNECSLRAGELLLKAGLGIIGWTPLVPTVSARTSGLHGAGSRVGARGRKRTAAVAGLPRDPVGREEAEAARYSSRSRDVLLNNPFVTPADLEAVDDTGARALRRLAIYRSSAGSGARARGRGPASWSPRGGAGNGAGTRTSTYPPANPYSVAVTSTPMGMEEDAEAEEEEERVPQVGPDTLDAARADLLQNAVAAVLRSLLAGRASFEPPDDPLSALHFDDDYSCGGPTASRAAPVPPSETDCAILGLRCLHRIYDIDGRYFHDEYAIYAYAYATVLHISSSFFSCYIIFFFNL